MPIGRLLGGHLGGLGALGALQHLDDLLLLDQEGAHDALANALVAQHAAVRTAHGLLALGDARALRRTGRPDAVQLLLALAALRHVTALLHVLVDQTAAGRANTANARDGIWLGSAISIDTFNIDRQWFSGVHFGVCYDAYRVGSDAYRVHHFELASSKQMESHAHMHTHTR